MARWARISSLKSSSSKPMDSVLGPRGHGGPHDAADDVNQLGPARLLAQQLLLAFGGELVELGALVRLADAPFGLQPAPFHEAVQGRIEGTGFDPEQVV